MEEAHPVPQNISSFEFHLVGDMTLKQFTYLAMGLAAAYLIFIFFNKSYPYVAWPLIVISALLGVSYAFLPVAERPLDHWTAAFFKAIFKPTQRKYSSKIINKDDSRFNKRLDLYLQSITAPIPQKPVGPPSLTNMPSISQLGRPQSAPSNAAMPVMQPSAINHQPSTAPSPQPTPIAPQTQDPSQDELKKTVDLAKQAQSIQSKIVEDENKLQEIKHQASEGNADSAHFTKQFETVMSDLQELNKEASGISDQLAGITRTPVAKPTVAATSEVKIVPSLSLTSIPNIINGIITDPQGNYIEGAIIVAHDKQGLPVRALKSNKLGQFITATPLPDGTYTVTAEKEGLTFPSYDLELRGEVLKPIVISAQG